MSKTTCLITTKKMIDISKELNVPLDTIKDKVTKIIDVKTLQLSTNEEIKVKPEIKELFNSNPELSVIGSALQYSTYLNSIFPDSKVKDIVYHASDVENLQQFSLKYFGQKDTGDRGYGIYLSKDKNIAGGYGEYLYSVIINIKNPYNVKFKDNDPSYLWNRIEKNTYNQDIIKLEDSREKWINKVKNNDIEYAFFEELSKNTTKQEQLDFVNNRINKQISDKTERLDELNIIKEADGVINEDYEIVTKPEQTHILGSKQDIEGFKEFINKETTTEQEIDYTLEEVKKQLEADYTPEQLQELKSIKPNPKELFNNDFDSVTKMYRTNLIAREFTILIDDYIKNNPGTSRADAIDFLTPKGIFEAILAKYLKLRDESTNSVFNLKLDLIIKYYWQLAQIATSKLTFTEDIIISIDAQYKVDKKESNDISPDGNIDNNQDDDNTEQENRILDGWQVKHQHLSSVFSMSQEVKRVLSTMPDFKYNGKLRLDDLNQPVLVDFSWAANTLITGLRGMTSANDLIPTLQDMSKQFPWIKLLLKKFKSDKSLESQFYKVMRKDFVNMTVQKSEVKGGKRTYKIVPVNRIQGVDFITSKIKDAILRNVTLYGSIYDRAGNVSNTKAKTISDKLTTLKKALDKELNQTTDNSIKNGIIQEFLNPVDIESFKNLNALTEIKNALSGLGIDIEIDALQFALTKGLYSDTAVLFPISINSMFTYLANIYDNLAKGKEIVTTQTLFQLNSKQYTNIAELLSVSVIDALESSSFENGKMYYSHQVPNYLGKLVKNLKAEHGNINRFNDFINKEFKQYSWFYDERFKDSKIKSPWKNYWLKELSRQDKAGKNARDLFDFSVMLNFDKVDYSSLTDLDYTLSLMNNFFIDENELFANYHIPMLSDSPVAASIKFKRFTDDNSPLEDDASTADALNKPKYKEFLLNRFIDIALQEARRIQEVLKRQQGIKDKSTVSINNYDKRGQEFCFLPVLNQYKDTILKLIDKSDVQSATELNTLLKEVLQSDTDTQFEQAMSAWLDMGIFDTVSPSDNRLAVFGPAINMKDARTKLENYFWNSKFATIQIIQLTNTDLAYFKNNIDDFLKRNKLIYAPAERLNVNSQHGRKIERTVTIQDNNVISKKAVRDGIKSSLLNNKLLSAVDRAKIESNYGVYNNIIFTLNKIRYGEITDNDGNNHGYYVTENGKNNPISKEEYLNAKSYVEDKDLTYLYTIKQGDKNISFRTNFINETDAQAYRSLSSMRAILDMAGKWDSTMEQAYNDIMSNNYTMGQLDFMIQVVKPFLYTQVSRDSGQKDENGNTIYIKVPVQNKNSELLLLPSMGVMQNSPTLKAINTFMEKNNIDVVQFETTVKVGLQGAIAIESTGENASYATTLNRLEETLQNKLTYYEVDYEDYGIQLEVPEHYIDSTQGIGTLLRKLITADMADNMVIPLKIGGKDMKLTKKQWLRLYNALNTANIIDSFKRISDEFADITKIEKILQDEIKGNPRYGQEIADACTLVNGQFNIPLFEPSQSVRIQTLINSILRSRITNLKSAGGSLVQATNFGLSQDLSIIFSEDGKSIEAFECYMPWYSLKYLKHLIDPKTNTIDITKVPSDLLELIGYRIPTEDKYSMAPLRIKGFLPQESGGVIMLPSEITTISGSDKK